jgi:LysM repeat protein
MNRNLHIRVWLVILVLCLFLSPAAALAAPPPPPAPPAPGPAYPGYHMVRQGENLFRIAMWYGTSVWAIAQVNGIWDVNYIRAGQVLWIPGSGPGPRPGPGPSPRYYFVRAGDTLSGIAWRFGTTAWAIAQANGIWNYNLIYIGQRLFIP